ncbi:MAG: GGDEF domain-containing protein [Candidatus Micrarchaeota archaeon]|nr:GGDEF domain-containing protein [Candidatus Micrarchaeota archaeon]
MHTQRRRYFQIKKFHENYQKSSSLKKSLLRVFNPFLYRDTKLFYPIIEELERLRTNLKLDPKFARLKVHSPCILDEIFDNEKARYVGRRSMDIMPEHSSLIMLDIDDFKRINSLLTHQGGDIVLEELIKLIRSVLRDTDMIIRYGGEEFMVYLPYTPVQDATHIAERIRINVEQKLLEKTYSRFLSQKETWTKEIQKLDQLSAITVTLGVAEIYKYEYLFELIRDLSGAVITGKLNGKNTICVPERFIDK